MFRFTYRPKEDRDHSRTEYFNDTKDLSQAILNLTDSDKEADLAYKWLERAGFKDKVIRQKFNYKIECFNEDELKSKVENVVKEVCNKIGIGYTFAGWDNDELTWDIDAGLSWIKFHDNYGYYIVVNKQNPDGGVTEMFSLKTKDKNKFIVDSVVGVEKAISKQLKLTKNLKPVDNYWHKHYVSGANHKVGPNDHIDYYYKSNGAKISVQYVDWRHNRACAYAAYDASGKSLGCYSKLYEAQRVIDLGK